MLEHLSITRQQLLDRKRGEEVGTDNHLLGLGKHTNAVLQTHIIEPRLTSERGVHLSQQSGGDINKINAAHISGCHKPS